MEEYKQRLQNVLDLKEKKKTILSRLREIDKELWNSEIKLFLVYNMI